METKMMKTLMICVAIVMAGIFTMKGTAQSKAINLKYAGLLPPGTTLSAPVDEWGKLVAERTKGQVTLTTYHAQSLGKFPEFPKLMKSGLCDMAFVGGPSPGFDLIGVAELPPLAGQAIQAHQKFFPLCRPLTGRQPLSPPGYMSSGPGRMRPG